MEMGLLVRRWANRCTPLDCSSAAARNREARQNGNKEKRTQNKTEAGPVAGGGERTEGEKH